ncbi:P-element somatic inhibitor [Arthroderma uncinatum]|uniref:P-element somatic inhibitor n=1 Tax=Arthroderma uncinatum TaxID=74035 RepID=UPI00144AEA51|nr:P-element somatic inhibitor [Arthroderma uncinatum]KAF3481351.1 P-element somatic inhibitor [Arthroderma uncinatum]
MGEQQNISQILAALAAVRPAAGGAQYNTGAAQSSAPPPPSTNAGGYTLPQPDSTGSLNIGGVTPANAGPRNPEIQVLGHIDARDRPLEHHRALPLVEMCLEMDTILTETNAAELIDVVPVIVDMHENDRHLLDQTRGAERHTPLYPTDITERLATGLRRHGENLRRIEADTGARVQFLDSPEHNKSIRLCRISGSKPVRDEAKAEIDRVVSEGNQSRGGGGQQGDRSGQDGGRPKPGEGDGSDSMQIMVPDRTVGLIIGRSGETIKDLQERSGCRVNIARDGESVNGLRPVSLTGSQQAMQHAKELILGIVESDSRQGGNQGPREPRGQAMGAESGGGDGDKINDKIFIPKESVGMVIGKGGETIKEIQSFSGCKINILPLVGREPEREVTLYGAQTAIDAAKRAIMAKVEAAQKSRSQGPRRDDSYNQQPQYQQQQQQQPYSQDPNSQQQQQHAMQPGAGEAADPYAMYGGYENYMAMWYAAMAQQQQQQQPQYPQHPGGGGPPPSGSDQPGPPGVS